MLRQALCTTTLAVAVSTAWGQDVPPVQPNGPGSTMPAQGEGNLLSNLECEVAVANDVSDVANVRHVLPDMNLSQADQAQALAEMALILDRVVTACAPIDYSLPSMP